MGQKRSHDASAPAKRVVWWTRPSPSQPLLPHQKVGSQEAGSQPPRKKMHVMISPEPQIEGESWEDMVVRTGASILVIKQIPLEMTITELMRDLDNLELAPGTYNFVHLPISNNDAKSRGFACVGFDSVQTAASFARDLSLVKTAFGGTIEQIEVAVNQNVQANLDQMNWRRRRRIVVLAHKMGLPSGHGCPHVRLDGVMRPICGEKDVLEQVHAKNGEYFATLTDVRKVYPAVEDAG